MTNSMTLASLFLAAFLLPGAGLAAAAADARCLGEPATWLPGALQVEDPYGPGPGELAEPENRGTAGAHDCALA